MPIRSAEYTIAGYFYQFLKTIEQILLTATAKQEVMVEGYIEDIDVETPDGLECIQCKYHAGQAKFQISTIYKPILLMLDHFKKNQTMRIKYVIYAHFPSESPGQKKIEEVEIQKLLGSKNQDFGDLLKELKHIDNESVRNFLSKFEFHFGLSLEALEERVKGLLQENFPKHSSDDIESLIFPNAFVTVSKLHAELDIGKRKVTKASFKQNLQSTKTDLFNRWLLEYRGKTVLLKKAKSRLKSQLNYNARKRVLILAQSQIENFDTVIVEFVSKFAYKYNRKPVHTHPTIFCLDCDEASFKKIIQGLYRKNISYTDGMVAGEFMQEKFLRTPAILKSNSTREFLVRVMNIDNAEILNTYSYDDLYIVSHAKYNLSYQADACIEILKLERIEEVEYVMGLREEL